MAVSPCKPFDSSFEQLERFMIDCENAGPEHVEKNMDILKKHPKYANLETNTLKNIEVVEKYANTEQTFKKRGRKPKIE